MGKYRKTIAAVVGAVLAWGDRVLDSPSGPVTGREWLAAAVAVAAAAGVYGVTNRGA